MHKKNKKNTAAKKENSNRNNALVSNSVLFVYKGKEITEEMFTKEWFMENMLPKDKK